MNPTTTDGGGAMLSHTTSTNEPQFKPQTYEQWKAAHGWQPEAEPRLEIGQRVKAAHDLDDEDAYPDFEDMDEDIEYDPDDPELQPEYVDEGTLGTVTKWHDTYDTWYEVHFDNGVVFYCVWEHDGELDDGWEGGAEIKPVGKSPSQLAYEQSERERLAAYRQLSLFDAAQTGGAS